MPYKNIEERRANRRAYYWRKREQVLAHQASYRELNKDKIEERVKLYSLEHPDKMIEYQVRYREKHRDRKRLSNSRYLKAHLDKRSHYAKTHRARKLNPNCSKPATIDDIKMRWAFYGNLCWMCGKPAEQTDHVKPLSKGGSHLPCNLRPACASCNHKKSNKWIPNDIEAYRKKVA